jgi:cell division protein FtsQ
MVKVFWTVATAGLGVLCLSAVNYMKNTPLRGIVVDLSGARQGQYFMSEKDIEREVAKVMGSPEKHTVGDVSCDMVEEVLSRNPFIEKADVYVSGNAKLTAQITQREPVMRVISEGQNFYLDSKGVRMPVSQQYTARVHVVTGPMAAAHARDVLELILKIREDKFMNAFVEQLHYAAKDEIVLIPKVGHTRILFGNPDRIDEKFENIKAFYSEVIAQSGWDLYRLIDLRFRDQIICKKNPTS